MRICPGSFRMYTMQASRSKGRVSSELLLAVCAPWLLKLLKQLSPKARTLWGLCYGDLRGCLWGPTQQL